MLLLLFSLTALALPGSFEIWLLSTPPELSFLPKTVYSKKIANYSCQKMGDLCFDPQIGLFDPKDVDALEQIDSDRIIQDIPQLPTASSIDRNMIRCKKGYHFDIFCGKAREEKVNKSGLHVWIDTSSSLRGKDPSDRQYNCNRKSFISYLKADCASAPYFSVFDTSKKQLGSLNSSCTTKGLNDTKRLIKWIKESNAQKLIVITDINEYTMELIDFVKLNKGKFVGEQVEKPLYPVDMLEKTKSLAKYCR